MRSVAARKPATMESSGSSRAALFADPTGGAATSSPAEPPVSAGRLRAADPFGLPMAILLDVTAADPVIPEGPPRQGPNHHDRRGRQGHLRPSAGVILK